MLRITPPTQCNPRPQISGLVNGDALAALTARGVVCGTGDNTWAHLRNADAPHSMLYSTKVTGRERAG